MAIAVAQEVQGQDPNFSTNGTTIAATITVAAGSALHVFAFANGASGLTASISDGTNTYTAIGTVFQSGKLFHWYVLSVAAGTYTVTVTFGSTVNLKGILLREITSTNAFQTHIEAGPASPGTGTDAVTSGSMTPTSQPALVSGLAMDAFFGGTPTAGTGYSTLGSVWAFGDPSSYARAEHKRITATTGVAATWTTSSGTDKFCIAAAIFTEASGLTLALTGVSSTAAVGTLAPGVSKALTGNASTAAVGTVAPGLSTGITGNATTAAVGTLSPSVTIPLTGAAATGAVGTVTVSGSNVTLALTGVAATGAAGTLGPSLALGLTGAAASSAVGTVGASLSLALTGAASTAAAGTVAPGTSKGLTGTASTAAVGSLALSMTVPLTGTAATGSAGNITTSGGTPTAAVALSRWKLDETSGTTLADSIGSNTLTIGSGVTLNVTPPAVLTSSTGAARGTTGCIGAKASATGLPNGTASQSWSLWVKAVSNTPAQAIFSLTNAAITAGAGVVISAGSILMLEYSGAATIVSATAPSTGNWHHVAWTYDGTSTTSLLYVDGSQVGSATGGLVSSTTADVILGTTDSGTTSPFAGDVDDVRVFSGVLTAAQITRMAAGGEPNDTTLALTGVAATGAAGTVGPARAVALTGAASSSAVGSLGIGMSVVLTGASAAGAAGTIGPGRSVGITGVAASSAVGSVTPAISIALTGAVAVGQLGTIGVNGNLTIALTGVSSTGAAGTVGPGRSVPVSGVALAGAVGSLGVAVSRALTGVGATGIVGNLTIPVPLVPLFPPFVAELGSVQLTAESTGDTLTVTGDT